LDANESYDPDGSIAAYEWREGQTLLGIEMTLMQQFGAGLHTITLTVTDNEDANGTDTVDINVRALPGQFFANKLWTDSLPVLHSCAVANDNSVKCWGYNAYGQLGNGTTTSSLTPTTVSGINNATAVAVGNFHTCALLSDGSIKCWGAGDNGRLGHGGGTGHRYTPVSVEGINNAIAISLGWSHSCALLSDGGIKCWGYNLHGQVGDGTSGDSNVTKRSPVSVVGIDTAIDIAAGGNHTCAIATDQYGNRVKCWGRGTSGQLGNHMFLNQSTPVTIFRNEIVNAVSLSLGSEFSCVLVSDSKVRCWGDNDYGQLGINNTTTRYSPMFVLNADLSRFSNATAVAVGNTHACALLTDGSMKCWGSNSFGQLGDNTTTSKRTPVPVSGISNAVDIALGGRHSCAQLTNKSLKCWGYNTYGTVGDGTTTGRLTPVNVIN